MFLGEVFERFAAQSRVSVMARAAFEHALSADAVDAVFEEHAERQYTRDLCLRCMAWLDWHDGASRFFCAAV